MSTLFLLASVAVAHSDLSFVLTGPETEARAGDQVHFSITGAQKLVTYELEIGGDDVLEGGAAGGSVISGEFTMPDLGQAARTVTVEAELRGPGKKKTTVKRKLQYLGPAPQASGPIEIQPVAPPVVPQQSVSAPAPVHMPAAAVTPALPAPTPATTRRSTRTPPRHARKRHAVKRRRHTHRKRSVRRERHRGGSKSGNRSKRPAPRTAPLFDGVPEPGYRRHLPGNDAPGLKAIAPPTAALTATAGDPGEGGESAVAILVPGLLGLAALALTGTTLARRRRTR